MITRMCQTWVSVWKARSGDEGGSGLVIMLRRESMGGVRVEGPPPPGPPGPPYELEPDWPALGPPPPTPPPPVKAASEMMDVRREATPEMAENRRGGRRSVPSISSSSSDSDSSFKKVKGEEDREVHEYMRD